MYNNREKDSCRLRGTLQSVEQAAHDLRDASTQAEELLWQVLRNRKVDGLKFRRQHPAGGFILDFYCSHKKLVIELDGEFHEYQAEHDKAREEHLESFNYHVIRFSNEQVLNNLEGVIESIRAVAKRL